jgi:hypothetical protein
MRLITLGDELTYSPSWATHLSQRLDRKLINLSKPNSNIEEQIFSMQDFLFDNDIDFEDTIIWQLSSITERKSFVGPTLNEVLESPSKYYFYLTNQKKNNQITLPMPEDSQLTEILSLLITLRKWTDRILIFRSYREIISSDKIKPFANKLTESRIEFISETPIDWCYENNLFFNTNGIPSYESQVKFCDKKIMPVFNLMKWI